MYGKLAVAAGFAAGYVLGSRAGRQRYEEIVAQARKVAGNEKVQSTAGALQAKGTELVDKAKQSDIATKVKSAVGADKSDAPSYGSTVDSRPGSSDLFEPTSSTTPSTGWARRRAVPASSPRTGSRCSRRASPWSFDRPWRSHIELSTVRTTSSRQWAVFHHCSASRSRLQARRWLA